MTSGFFLRKNVSFVSLFDWIGLLLWDKSRTIYIIMGQIE
jgi:hypothetical protein